MNNVLDIIEHHSLQQLNTLNIPAEARYFLEITDSIQIPQALQFCRDEKINPVVIGGGSNIIFSQNQNALVLQIKNYGISIERVKEAVFVTAQAGENWHQLVMYCLKQGYSGLENLIMIPGTVGAAPVQNIGAYGVELQQVFHSLKGWDIEAQCWRTMTLDQCEFEYRDSVFKRDLKDKFIITEVTFRLTTSERVHTDYASLAAYLLEQDITDPNANDVARCVTQIRKSKLPDPNDLPNVGSFFKNPIISPERLHELRKSYPDIISYKLDNYNYKLAAAWLIEKTGWKGRRLAGVGVHDKQSLVLINYEGATGEQLLDLARQVKADVFNMFGISLSIEPRIY